MKPKTDAAWDRWISTLPPAAKGTAPLHMIGNPTGFAIRQMPASRRYYLAFRFEGRSRLHPIGEFGAWNTARARAYAKELRQQIDRGHDPQAKKQERRQASDIRELAEMYKLENLPHKRPGSVRGDLLTLKNHILPRLGRRKLIDLRHGDVTAFHREVTERAGPIAGNHALQILRAMLNLALRHELVPTNVAVGVKQNAEVKRETYLTDTETLRLVRVLEDMGTVQSRALLLIVHSGCRKSEALRARWDQINMRKAVWSKPASAVKQNRIHTAPLPAPAMALLKSMHPKRLNDAWLFTSPRDHRQPLSQVEVAWKQAKKLARIDSGVRIHDLRHSFCSRLVNQNIDLFTIGKLVGHSSAVTTSRYSHLRMDVLKQAIGKSVISTERPDLDPQVRREAIAEVKASRSRQRHELKPAARRRAKREIPEAAE